MLTQADFEKKLDEEIDRAGGGDAKRKDTPEPPLRRVRSKQSYLSLTL